MAFSKSKSIRRASTGLIVPNVENKAFRYFGHDCNTSKSELAMGDCAKSSTIL